MFIQGVSHVRLNLLRWNISFNFNSTFSTSKEFKEIIFNHVTFPKIFRGGCEGLLAFGKCLHIQIFRALPQLKVI